MEWLNYHHLLYFWLVVREGGLAPAAAKLRLSPPTVSAQVHALEGVLQERLLVKRGRKLELTDVGRVVYRYAEEIFTIGRELQDTLKGRPSGRPLRLVVGVANAVPKLIARRLLAPAQNLGHAVQLVCREDHPERLLAALALHELDVVLTDSAAHVKGGGVRVFSHLLGECGVSFFATKKLARKLEPGFPASLDGAPALLPTESAGLRRQLDAWFERERVRPLLVGEFDDSALLKAFAQDGMGFFASPSVIATEVERQYSVVRIGQVDSIRERFYAITAERRIRHPAVVAISEAAHREIFPVAGR